VIAAAVKLANKKGYRELTLGNLARQLDIKPPSLYKHVASLDDLQDALGIIAAEALTTELAPAMEIQNPQQALRAACDIYRGFAHKKPGLYASLQPAMARRSAPFQVAATELLKTIFVLVSALGVKKDNLVHAVRALRALLHGFAELESIGGFGMPEDIEASFRYQVEVYIRGLRG
jgi:AcrR family transcriptional regulator